MGGDRGDHSEEATGEGNIEPQQLVASRADLHRVATHVLARRRHDVSGRFGLRATPGGFGTPAFGDGPDGPEVLRVTARHIVRETGGTAAYRDLSPATLRQLADFAGVDLTVDFSAGGDTPAVGDPDAPLHLPYPAVSLLTAWYALGWAALDRTVATAGSDGTAATIQLWPEHFDAGTSLALADGTGVNLGASPGDSFSPEPYLYVGPHGPERPGDPGYWNVPFGALLTRSELMTRSSGDPVRAAAGFLQAGLNLLRGE